MKSQKVNSQSLTCDDNTGTRKFRYVQNFKNKKFKT